MKTALARVFGRVIIILLTRSGGVKSMTEQDRKKLAEMTSAELRKYLVDNNNNPKTAQAALQELMNREVNSSLNINI